MKRNWIYIHIHTTVLSAQKGGGPFEKHSRIFTHTSREAFFYGCFFFLSPSKSSVNALWGPVVVFFFSPLLSCFGQLYMRRCSLRVMRDQRRSRGKDASSSSSSSSSSSRGNWARSRFFSTPPPSRMMMMMMMMGGGGVRALFLCVRKEEAQRGAF